MKLTSIHLQNYRAHQDLRVEFSANFNLVVGINGSGKTSLLKGVTEGLGASLMGMLSKSPFPILTEFGYAHVYSCEYEGLYRFEEQFPVSVTMAGFALSRDFSITVKKKNSISIQETDKLSPIHDLIQGPINEYTGREALILPLIAFYRAGRQWVSKPIPVIQAATEKVSRKDGYQQWWDAAADVSSFQHWVIGKCLERYQFSSENKKGFYEIKDDELALVNTALAAAIDGIGDLRYDMRQKNLLVGWKTENETQRTIPFDHLSDGQRAVICLVADIARRICLLNPHLGEDVIRQTPGVVLIDELDVHLHPSWQRQIVNGLKKAFPQIQFIATSHSPQILGELRPEEIILLREGGTSQPQVSYGLDSSQVLEEVMGAYARNQDVDKSLKQLFLEIENNQISEAKSRLNELRKNTPQIPELGRAEAIIRRKEIIGR